MRTPKLDESTCQKFGSEKRPGPARIALMSGLNVGLCVCPNCEFAKTCDYPKQREEARTADHTIATHDRASLSDFKPSDEKPITFIHEDPLKLLRPMAKVVRFSKNEKSCQLRHLQEIVLIAQEAEQIGVIWNDDVARQFTKRLQGAAQELVAILNSPDLVQPLEAAIANGQSTKKLPTVIALPMKVFFPRHARMDLLLKRAMDQSVFFCEK